MGVFHLILHHHLLVYMDVFHLVLHHHLLVCMGVFHLILHHHLLVCMVVFPLILHFPQFFKLILRYIHPYDWLHMIFFRHFRHLILIFGLNIHRDHDDHLLHLGRHLFFLLLVLEFLPIINVNLQLQVFILQAFIHCFLLDEQFLVFNFDYVFVFLALHHL